MALSNKEVSRYFKSLAALMEVHGESDFRTKSYTNAAFQLGRLSEPVMTVAPEVLEKLPGVGKGIAAKIMELRETGTIAQLDELTAQTPPGIVEILQIKGLGGKKVRDIWTQLGIESVGELLYACYENRLAKLKGFGEKTQASVIQSIEYYQNNLGKFHLAAVADYADTLIEHLQKVCKDTRVVLTGDLRRKSNVIERMEILAPESADITKHIEAIPELVITEQSAALISGKTTHELPFSVQIVPDAAYGFYLFTTTGCAEHVAEVLAKAGDAVSITNGVADEQTIYAAAGMSYVMPQMREVFGGGITSVDPGDDLVQMSHIQGVVHNHSTWSDGKNSILEMAEACMEKGYGYLVMSDHSKSAFYAGGLSEEQIMRQHQEIDNLNGKLGNFRIFKSIECDILYDGQLDYDADILKRFDLVIVSVHAQLKMDIEKATSRLLQAIAHPATRILGHMTGRLLLSRPGYPVHHQQIIDACAAHGVAIEINANPYRLDIDYSWIPYAMSKGVLISINPDAHSVEGINDIRWGLTSAQKGGLTRAMTLNAKSLEEFERWMLR